MWGWMLFAAYLLVGVVASWFVMRWLADYDPYFTPDWIVGTGMLFVTLFWPIFVIGALLALVGRVVRRTW